MTTAISRPPAHGFNRSDQAGQRRPNGPAGNAEQFAYPHRCAGWELGRVIAEQRAERDRPGHQRLDGGQVPPGRGRAASCLEVRSQ